MSSGVLVWGGGVGEREKKGRSASPELWERDLEGARKGEKAASDCCDSLNSGPSNPKVV